MQIFNPLGQWIVKVNSGLYDGKKRKKIQTSSGKPKHIVIRSSISGSIIKWQAGLTMGVVAMSYKMDMDSVDAYYKIMYGITRPKLWSSERLIQGMLIKTCRTIQSLGFPVCCSAKFLVKPIPGLTIEGLSQFYQVSPRLLVGFLYPDIPETNKQKTRAKFKEVISKCAFPIIHNTVIELSLSKYVSMHPDNNPKLEFKPTQNVDNTGNGGPLIPA